MSQPPVLTIAQLTDQLRDTLATDFGDIWVGGEVSSATKPQSGHIYLTLKDKNAQLQAVIWKGVASRLRFAIEEGLEVICHGGIDIYPPRGSYQLIIRHIEPRGVGDLQLAFKQLHEKLNKEGLFNPEHKKPIPEFPRSIAFVTSSTGAAIHDFVQIAVRRWPSMPIMLIPAKVQGEGSVKDTVNGIKAAHKLSPRPDVLVVGRGGGSLEDLWSFNEEKVVRAIFESEIPIVSAVGHEVDVTLSDLVADQRALTPSEAAERIVPNAAELLNLLKLSQQRIGKLLHDQVSIAKERLDRLVSSRVLSRPLSHIQQHALTIDDMDQQLQRSVKRVIQTTQDKLNATAARLHALSPLNVLKRGYSVTQTEDGKVIHGVDQVKSGEQITTRLTNGTIKSIIESTETKS